MCITKVYDYTLVHICIQVFAIVLVTEFAVGEVPHCKCISRYSYNNMH